MHWIARLAAVASLISTSPAVADITLGATPIPNPIKLAAGAWFEPSVAVVSGGSCKTSHIIARGREQDTWWDLPFDTKTVAARSLAFGKIPSAPAYVTEGTTPDPKANTVIGGYDNTSQSLPDGSAVLQTGSYTWADNVGEHPTWWAEDFPGVSAATNNVRKTTPGVRGFSAFWKVSGCNAGAGGVEIPAMTTAGVIDNAFAGAVDENGKALPADYCALNPGGIAGWDRPQIHADTFKTGRLYLSYACARKTSSTEWEETEIIYRSDDFGSSWTPILNLPHTLFYSIATLPTGSLWLLGGSTIRHLQPTGSLQAISDLSGVGGAPTTRSIVGVSKVSSANPSIEPPHVLGRLGKRSLVAAYPVDDPKGAGLAYALVLISNADSWAATFKSLPGTPVLEPTQAGGSILTLSLVPDLRPQGAGVLLAYWLESDTPPAPDAHNKIAVTLHERYAVISPLTNRVELKGDIATWTATYDLAQVITDPATGAVKDNNPWYGDYTHGAGFIGADANTANFALAWTQEDGLYARTLTVVDAVEPPSPPNPCQLNHLNLCQVTASIPCLQKRTCGIIQSLPPYCAACGTVSPFVKIVVDGIDPREWRVSLVDTVTRQPIAAQALKTSSSTIEFTFRPDPGRYRPGAAATGFAVAIEPRFDRAIGEPTNVRITAKPTGAPRLIDNELDKRGRPARSAALTPD